MQVATHGLWWFKIKLRSMLSFDVNSCYKSSAVFTRLAQHNPNPSTYLHTKNSSKDRRLRRRRQTETQYLLDWHYLEHRNIADRSLDWKYICRTLRKHYLGILRGSWTAYQWNPETSVERCLFQFEHPNDMAPLDVRIGVSRSLHESSRNTRVRLEPAEIMPATVINVA